MSIGPKIVRSGLVFGYDADDRCRFYDGEPTVNLVPNPEANSRFTTSNWWSTYNTNQYCGNNGCGVYWDIPAIVDVSNNIVTTIGNHQIRTFDVINPQTTGGGVSAGANYVAKKISDTQFALYQYNSSENGSQGYINPATGFYKVHDAYATDTKIPLNSTDFPTKWFGGAHLPNSGLIKEIINGGGRVKGTNCMRLHIYRGDGVVDGMAYGVYCPVTVGDVITISVWLKAATPNAVGKGLNYTTYFGPSYAAGQSYLVLGEYNKWIRYTYTWTASNTVAFYSYWFPEGSVDKYDIDMADFQVEVNRGHATQYTVSSRTANQSLYNLKDKSPIDTSTASFDSTAHPEFDGTNDYLSFTGLTLNPNINGFSFECVLKSYTTNTSWGTWKTLLDFNTYGNGFFGILVEADSRGYRLDVPNLSNTRLGANSGTIIPANEYQHIVFTWKNGVFQLYINNALIVSTNEGAYQTFPITSLRLGRSVNGVWYGKLPMVRLYDRVLLSNEVEQNYNSSKKIYNI